eukprot:CAMPEP_0197444256 /NCGR_PEP_ID=MMETSP1175-20131217/9788_1 /TAXON_ID=1003142 /ORGANISM="Triceratium dubium, Strain CCMP147" /LENGTH=194 /DNA_ID=CAMNT_0042975015 /DNA_START=176 /DNA_END=757 /DNA_ORIENTATION=+
MKFSSISILSLVLSKTGAFQPHNRLRTPTTIRSNERFMSMDMDMPPANNVPGIVQTTASANTLPELKSIGGAPADVRYSDFLKLVDADRIEKVTFSADGTKLLGVDTDGVRVQIGSLPNDPDLLTQLTNHKVDVTVLPVQEASGLGELAQSLILPAALFAGLFFLSRRSGGADMGGGFGGGPGNPMGFGKSKAE